MHLINWNSLKIQAQCGNIYLYSYIFHHHWLLRNIYACICMCVCVYIHIYIQSLAVNDSGCKSSFQYPSFKFLSLTPSCSIYMLSWYKLITWLTKNSYYKQEKFQLCHFSKIPFCTNCRSFFVQSVTPSPFYKGYFN